MILRYLKAILNFALSRPTAGQRVACFLKGLLFAPWLMRTISGRVAGDSDAAANSQLGDDIYPLF